MLLSGIAYPNSIPGKIVAAWRNSNIEVVLSHYILDELQRVLPKLNHRLGWSSQEIRDFVDRLAFLADLVEPVETTHKLLRDETELPVLGALLASKAIYLVTSDKDLLALSTIYPVVKPADFWKIHGS